MGVLRLVVLLVVVVGVEECRHDDRGSIQHPSEDRQEKRGDGRLEKEEKEEKKASRNVGSWRLRTCKRKVGVEKEERERGRSNWSGGVSLWEGGEGKKRGVFWG